MQQFQSIDREINRQSRFKPPFCPNPTCQFHSRENTNTCFYVNYGWSKIGRFPYRTKRYLCKKCLKTFSYTFFFLDYGERLWGLNEAIFEMRSNGASSMCGIARRIRTSEHLVRRRLIKMSRFSLLKHAYLTRKLPVLETIVYDGLQNFSYSQYDPNNINHAIGKETLFLYDFNFAPMNRKGRMSTRQKVIKKKLEEKHGPYPRDAIRTATRNIVARLHSRSPTKVLNFLSDNHFQYRRAIREDLPHLRIRHATVPSKIYRNYRNQLFAINHLDMLSRHHLAPFKRETISFSKTSISMQECFALFTVYKNYMRPRFVKKHKLDPLSNLRSPAMDAGVTDKILNFRDFFQNRVTIPQVELSSDWLSLVRRIDRYSRRPITPYKGI